jgi:hypothetical protein
LKAAAKFCFRFRLLHLRMCATALTICMTGNSYLQRSIKYQKRAAFHEDEEKCAWQAATSPIRVCGMELVSRAAHPDTDAERSRILAERKKASFMWVALYHSTVRREYLHAAWRPWERGPAYAPEL